MTDTTQLPPAAIPDNEIDLFDLLITIAENIKLLVIGPLLAGLLALGGVWAWPATYESSFTLNAQKILIVDGVEIKLIQPQQISAIAVAKPTLEAAAQSLIATNQSGLAQRILAGAVTSSSPRNTTHVSVTLQAPTAQAAHDMAQALLAATLKASRPQGEELARLTQDLQKDQAALDNARTLEARFDKVIKQVRNNDKDLAISYGALLSAISQQSMLVLRHRAQLAGLTEADVVIQPMLPNATSAPRKKIVVIFAVLIAVFLILMFIFICQFIRQACFKPEAVRKLILIRQTLNKTF